MVNMQQSLDIQIYDQEELPGIPSVHFPLKGTYYKLSERQLKAKIPKLFYSHSNGEVWLGDSLLWLKGLQSASVDLIFADPPYNIKKAEWDTFESQQAYLRWSLKWIKEAARILKPNGTLYICGFSEILADLKLPALRFFAGCRWLVWHYKNKANLGSDWVDLTKVFSILERAKNFLLILMIFGFLTETIRSNI